MKRKKKDDRRDETEGSAEREEKSERGTRNRDLVKERRGERERHS